ADKQQADAGLDQVGNLRIAVRLQLCPGEPCHAPRLGRRRCQVRIGICPVVVKVPWELVSPTATDDSVEMIGIGWVVAGTTTSGSDMTPAEMGSSIAMIDTDLVAGDSRRPRWMSTIVASASGMATALGAATQRDSLSTPNRPHSR